MLNYLSRRTIGNINMKKRVLGLDLGIASLGWAVVDLDEEQIIEAKDKEARYRITGGKIIAAGVRIFDEPVDRNGKSLAAIRGEKRRFRATIERKAERLKHFIKLAKQYKIISDNFTIKELNVPKGISYEDWNLWKLRAKAINEKLSNFEIFRVLYHIANHRGFYFPTKAEASEIDNPNKVEENNKSDKKIKGAISTVKNLYKQSEYKSIGEYIYHKEGKKRNKKEDYSVSLYRTEIYEEVEKIFKFQRENGNKILSQEFEERYINEVLMYTHLLDDEKIKKMIGECEFIKGELRFPKQGYEAELFTFYNRLNNLKIKGKNDFKFDKDKILNFVLNVKNCKISFSDLRKFLQLNDQDTFNLCSYHEYNPEYEKAIKIEKDKINEFKSENLELYDIETEKTQGSCWNKLKEIVEKYFEKYDTAKSIKYYYSDIRKQLNISVNQRFSKIKKEYVLSKSKIGISKYLAQFEKETFVEFSGYSILKKGLGDYFDKLSRNDLNSIAEALVYYQSDDGRKSYLQQCGLTDESLVDKILELNMRGVTFFSRKALYALNEKMKDGISFEDAKGKLVFEKESSTKTTKIEPYHGTFEQNATVARIIAEFRKTVNAINRQYGIIDEIHIEMATDVANSNDKIMRIRNGQIRYKEQRDAACKRCEEYGIDPNDGDNLLRFRLAEEQDFKCIYTNKQIFLGKKENTPEGQINIYECDIDHIIPISRSFNDSLSNKVICSNQANREKTNRLPYEWFNAHKDSESEEKWNKFKVRVLSGNKMSGAKKHNLLRESFTDEDMQNFISRDLDNTRYATRHIAEYLKKYFSFEQSENLQIKDINRVRVLGGGITAKLRHMWGLDKNRDESNLHHAQDAIVIACTSFGNIYYICSVLKNLEEKGIHVKKRQLEPWKDFRDEVFEALNKITVSKMVRASATGSAHKEPNKKKKGYTLIKRQDAQNVIDVQLDTMFRYDIYHNEKGYYCVPIYAIDLHPHEKKDFKHIACQNKDKFEAKENEFLFSLYKGSYVEIVTTDGEVFEGYIVQFNAGTGQFVIESINGDYNYQIITSTLKIGDYLLIQLDNGELQNFNVIEYDMNDKQLHLISNNGNVKMNIDAEMKSEKNEIETEKKSNAYKTSQTYIKLDKNKKINISVIKSFKKFTIDRLGNKTRVKKEKERFSNKLKSNAQRYREKQAQTAKQQLQGS